MKRIINKFSLVLVACLAVAGTSCLKDEGFDNGEYGSITGNTEGQEFVSIPASSRVDNVLTVGVEARSTVQTIPMFALSYDAASPAPADFTATLTPNNSLVTNPNVVLLPSNAYTLGTTTLNFKAGSRISDSLKININTDLLNPSITYALGFTLTAVSKAGVQIPSNLKNVIVYFTIKNKFDGVYQLRSKMELPADRPAGWLRTPFTYPFDILLVTTGPLSVEWINTAFGAGFHPLMTPGVSGFGATSVAMVFNSNNQLVSVFNAVPNPSNGRAFVIDPSYDGRYDPATKTIYSKFFMTQPGFAPVPITDTLYFLKPRP